MFKKKCIYAWAMAAGLFFMMAATVSGTDQDKKLTTSITVCTVGSQKILITEESVGRIESRVAPIVSAEETGLIVEMMADTGQYVDAGTLMAKIDNQAYCLAEDACKAEVERLEALIANQEKTVERYRNLLAKKSIPQDRMDAADVNLAALKDQLTAATAGLADSTRRRKKTQCLAPVSGWIERRFVTTGDFVNMGKPLFQITSDERLRVILPFPESVASKFQKGQTVLLNTPVMPDRTIESKISEIRPSVNIGNRAIEIIVDIDNPGSWRPGASINGTVIIREQPDTLIVPDKSVIRRPAGDVVYVIDQNIARERKVTTGLRVGDSLEILSGISKGDVIAVFGASYLTDNALIQIQENS